MQHEAVDRMHFSDRPWLLVMFFPITIYFFIGTTLLFLISKVQRAAVWLGDYSEFSAFDSYEVVEYHKAGVWHTALFPVLVPPLSFWVLVTLAFASFAALLRVVISLLTAIWRWAVKLVTAIWTWTIEALEDIWRTIKSVFD